MSKVVHRRSFGDDLAMPTSPRLVQHPILVVDLTGWELEDNPFGLPGKREKRIFICPQPPPHPFLIGGHRYLFKQPTAWREPQIWSEVIAYELSRDLGVPVPPAFLALGPGNGSPGVLIEFFYGYPDEERRRYVDAVDLLQGQGFGINLRSGSLRDNMQLSRFLGATGWKEWWCRTIALDALIGNVDRHSQNWGMLIRPAQEERRAEFFMAPAFDNGSSLGYNYPERDLPTQSSPAQIERLVAAGRHHVSWAGGLKGTQHSELCAEMKQKVRGGVGEAMNAAARLANDRIEAIVQWCASFTFPVAFSPERAHFVSEQLKARRDAIALALEL